MDKRQPALMLMSSLLLATAFVGGPADPELADSAFFHCPPPLETPPEDPIWSQCPSEDEPQPNHEHDGNAPQPGVVFAPDLGDDDVELPPGDIMTLARGGYLIPDVGHEDSAGRIGMFSEATTSSGSMDDLFESADVIISSSFSGDLLGASVAEVGETGASVGVPGYDMVGVFNSLPDGEYNIDDDADSFILGDTGSGFGQTQVVVGDTLAISAPGSSAGGTVFIVGEVDDGASWVDDVAVGSISGEGEGGLLGFRTATGDFNGDGEDDLAISDPNNDAVYVFFGSLSELGDVDVSDADVTLNGPEGSEAGTDLSVARSSEGEVTHLLIGAPGANSAYAATAAEVSAGGALSDVDASVTGGDDALFGLSVSTFGANHLLVGAPGENALYAFALTTGSQTTDDSVASLAGAEGYTQLGARVSAFNMDGDDFADVAVSAVSDDGETARWTTFQSGVMPE